MIPLEDRSILEICGPERRKFIQGLITNDINKVSEQSLIYSAMLNAQGRFLYDFFITEKDEKLILDCFANRCDEIMQKLNFYKLRTKVEIKKNNEIGIFYTSEKQGFIDPRNPNLGYRVYASKNKSTNKSTEHSNVYHRKRISLKIPESEHDLTYQKSFILEFGFNELNAVDYNKGCYVGQELTARTYHMGEVRKKVFYIKVDAKKIEKNSEITCEGKSAGIILSSFFHKDTLYCLALIRLKFSQSKLECDGKKILIIN